MVTPAEESQSRSDFGIPMVKQQTQLEWDRLLHRLFLLCNNNLHLVCEKKTQKKLYIAQNILCPERAHNQLFLYILCLKLCNLD